ncbi:MAG: 1-deoxy-D-xylulose-5-phosphate synthase [Patescibacteria group bacterium]
MFKLLNQVNSPADLKRLSLNQLPALSCELRDFIIENVSKTGGHLAPNLGVVELTLALHYIFESPRDKIIWDVGHQCYTHKILTGRKNRFYTLRQQDGISGFPVRAESEHDIFGTGHASTSISAALGFACARDFKKEKYKVCAVIGDGAISGGMSFEALNNVGAAKRDLIVVLNDNKMSISHNVGALSVYLNRLVSDPRYNQLRGRARKFLSRWPFGREAVKAARKLESAVMSVLGPSLLFEELGFKYIGPIDGHNIQELLTTFKNVKQIGGPILVHVVTKKGKGCSYAEHDATKYHGITPFNIKNGEKIEKKTPQITYSEVFVNTLIKLAQKDKKIIAITAAMPDGTGLSKFAKFFPDRFFDVGICEQHAVTFAAGLAVSGFKPVCAIYSTFLQRAYDQIIHDVALQKLPIIFAIDRAGIVGDDGPTHHGVFDISYLRHIPNMIAAAPKDENELQNLLKTAVDYKLGPIAIRYPRGVGEGVELEDFKKIEIGKAEVLQEGKDLAIVALGSMVYPALRVAKLLLEQGISAKVINARFVKPLDRQIILEAASCGKILTIEENSLSGGFGCAVLECLEQEKIKNLKIKRLGIPDKFISHGDVKILKNNLGLDEKGIFKAAEELLVSENIFSRIYNGLKIRNWKVGS